MNLNKINWVRRDQRGEHGELVALQLKGEDCIVEVYFKDKLVKRGKLIVSEDESEDDVFHNKLCNELKRKFFGHVPQSPKKQKSIDALIKRYLKPIEEKPKGFLTVKETAKILKTTEGNIRDLICRRKILSKKDEKGRILIEASEIDKLKQLKERLKKGEIYTFSQAAFILGLSYDSIKKWAKDGKIVFLTVKGRKFIPKSVVDELKNEGFTREEKRFALKKVVEILKVHPSTVWDWGKKGGIKIIRTPKGWPYVLESEVERVQEEIKTNPQFAYLRARRKKG